MELTHSLSIRLPDELTNKIKASARSKKKTFSAYLRYLIELGLRIEEVSDTPNPEKKLEAIAYKSILETAMLSRALIHSHAELGDEQKKDFLREASKQAVETVQKYLGKDALEKTN